MLPTLKQLKGFLGKCDHVMSEVIGVLFSDMGCTLQDDNQEANEVSSGVRKVHKAHTPYHLSKPGKRDLAERSRL